LSISKFYINILQFERVKLVKFKCDVYLVKRKFLLLLVSIITYYCDILFLIITVI